jgi:hypothetical protein
MLISKNEKIANTHTQKLFVSLIEKEKEYRREKKYILCARKRVKSKNDLEKFFLHVNGSMNSRRLN